MRLPDSAHTEQSWRIHDVAGDFRLEDVWELPSREDEDFARMVERFVSRDPARSSSAVVRALFALRWKLGELFGWDDEDTGLGARVPTLRDRLPADLRDGPAGPSSESLPFTTLYLTEDEWAAEVANKTVHGVMHIGRVQLEGGGHRDQMAVLVNPNGLFGSAYLIAIRPFRHLVVYPPMLREAAR